MISLASWTEPWEDFHKVQDFRHRLPEFELRGAGLGPASFVKPQRNRVAPPIPLQAPFSSGASQPSSSWMLNLPPPGGGASLLSRIKLHAEGSGVGTALAWPSGS